MTANKPETVLYRAPTFSHPASYGGISSFSVQFEYAVRMYRVNMQLLLCGLRVCTCVLPELMAADHCAKKEIIKLEEELPKWRTIINTGAPPGTYVHRKLIDLRT